MLGLNSNHALRFTILACKVYSLAFVSLALCNHLKMSPQKVTTHLPGIPELVYISRRDSVFGQNLAWLVISKTILKHIFLPDKRGKCHVLTAVCVLWPWDALIWGVPIRQLYYRRWHLALMPDSYWMIKITLNVFSKLV